MIEFGAVILAAGVSSRMGEFKPLLQIGGETMISRVVTMMRCAGVEHVVVVTGYRGVDVEERLKDEKIIFVHNEQFRKTQMFDSLLCGLGAIGDKCRKILISPADVPLVRPETVKAVLSCHGKFVRPVYRAEPGHPVLLSAKIIHTLEQYVGTGGLRGAMESSGFGIVEMETDDIGVILDCDTKEDYYCLLRYFNARKP